MTSVGLTPAVFDPSAAAGRELAFSEEEYEARLEKLCELMRETGIELLGGLRGERAHDDGAGELAARIASLLAR